MITIGQAQAMVYRTALEKGWWPRKTIPLTAVAEDEPIANMTSAIDFDAVNIPEKLMLMVTELGEAMEFYRDDVGMQGVVWKLKATGQWITQEDIRQSSTFNEYVTDKKPDGFWIELADCIIRILDLAGAYGINMEELVLMKAEYNKTRPYRHGGKKA